MEKRKATIGDALVSINPEIKFTYRAEDYDRLKILSGHSKPTKEEIDSEIVKIQADYDSKQYQRDRQYPSIQDQLDMQYWDRKNGTKTWEESIDKVKADNPKPE